IEAVNRALAADRLVFLSLQHGDEDEPHPDHLHKIGTIAAIRQMAKVPNGGIHVIVEGLQRARAETVVRHDAMLRANVAPQAQEFRGRVAAAKLPERVAAITNREIERLERMGPASPEYQMIRTYIDWVLDVPWSKTTEDRLDLVAARAVLDEDHYDLDKVKDRIIEYLAVQKLKNEQRGERRDSDDRRENPPAVSLKGPILCFVGPPGVGKTSLGQSI